MRTSRPALLTLVCVYHILYAAAYLGSLALGLYLLSAGSLDQEIAAAAAASGKAAGDLMTAYVLEAVTKIGLCGLYLVGILSMWLMRRWGVYLFLVGMFLIMVDSLPSLPLLLRMFLLVLHIGSALAAWFLVPVIDSNALQSSLQNLRNSGRFSR